MKSATAVSLLWLALWTVMAMGVEAQYRCTPSDCPPGVVLVQFENMDCTGSYNITSYGPIATMCIEVQGKSISMGDHGTSMTTGTYDSPGCPTSGDASYMLVRAFFGVCGMSPEMTEYKRTSQMSQAEVVHGHLDKMGRYLKEQKPRGDAVNPTKRMNGKRNSQEEVVPIRGTVYLRDISELASFTGRRRLAPATPIVPDIVYVPQEDCTSLDTCHNVNSTTRPQYITARYNDDTCSATSFIMAIEGGDWTNGRCLYSPPYTSFAESAPSSTPSTAITPAVLSIDDGLYMRSYCKDAHSLEQAFYVDSACSTSFSTITTRNLCATNGQETTECSATPPTAEPSSSASFLSSSLLLSSFLVYLLL